MLKGKELLDYAINKIDEKNKLQAIHILADDILLEFNEITKRAISLLNPIIQYEFIEKLLLEKLDIDRLIIDYLTEYSYPLPKRFGWKHVVLKEDSEEELIDECEWYEDKHKCYRDMYKSAFQTIEHCIDCVTEAVIISNDGESITIGCGGSTIKYYIYEME